MAVQTSYPGVDIEEFAPGAPIQGVGTSTAAFIGVASTGDLEVPTELTAWDDFKSTFGDQPIPGFYLWHAVQGFFQNGGQSCYIVRASNGAYATATITDSSAAANDLITVRARRPGNPATAISVTVAALHLLATGNTSLYQPTATLAGAPVGREITLTLAADTAQFRPGDAITVAAGGATANIIRVSGTTIRLDQALAGGPYVAGDTMRLADAAAGTRTIRIESTVPVAAGSLVPGTMLTIDDGVNPDAQIVQSVATEYVSSTVITYRVTFRQGLTFPLSLDPANPATIESEEFSLTVTQGAGTTYPNLSIDSAHPRYVIRMVNNDATGLVRLTMVDPPPPVSPPDNLPFAAAYALAGGADEDLTTIGDADFSARSTRSTQSTMSTWSPSPTASSSRIDPSDDGAAGADRRTASCWPIASRSSTRRQGLAALRCDRASRRSGRPRLRRGYAALYYPWLRVPPADGRSHVLVPPSGHVGGIYRAHRRARGVHKAPANESIVNGALGVERATERCRRRASSTSQGINVIRMFRTGGRPDRVGRAHHGHGHQLAVRAASAGCSCTSRRSIQEGIRWAVFEPNNLPLWQKLKRTITRLPDPRVARRRALRRQRGRGVLRAHRRGAQPVLGAAARAPAHRDRRAAELSGRVHHRPHRHLGRRAARSAKAERVALTRSADHGNTARHRPVRQLQLPRRDRRHHARRLPRGERLRLDDRRDRAPRGRRQHTPRKLPGHDEVLQHRPQVGLTTTTELYKWHRRGACAGRSTRKNGSIVLLDRQGQEKVRWNFFRAWPSKWTGPDFNAEGNDVAIETLELAHEGVERA